jgi:hypothetical protein
LATENKKIQKNQQKRFNSKTIQKMGCGSSSNKNDVAQQKPQSLVQQYQDPLPVSPTVKQQQTPPAPPPPPPPKTSPSKPAEVSRSPAPVEVVSSPKEVISPAPPSPLKVSNTFVPLVGYNVVTEDEITKDSMYLVIMHHSSVETFLSLEPRSVVVNNQTVSYYVVIISTDLYEKSLVSPDIKNEVSNQAVSHMNQFYHTHANSNICKVLQ